MAASPKLIPQELLVEEAVQSVPVPKAVRFSHVSFDTDFGDRPAIHVVFSVSKEYRHSKAGARKLGDLVRAVLSVLWSIQSTRVPYVNFEDER